MESFRPPVSMENVLIKGAAAGYKDRKIVPCCVMAAFRESVVQTETGSTVRTGKPSSSMFLPPLLAAIQGFLCILCRASWPLLSTCDSILCPSSSMRERRGSCESCVEPCGCGMILSRIGILHYLKDLKDPKLWELWDIPYYG